jgi:hypothetical protein
MKSSDTRPLESEDVNSTCMSLLKARKYFNNTIEFTVKSRIIRELMMGRWRFIPSDFCKTTKAILLPSHWICLE